MGKSLATSGRAKTNGVNKDHGATEKELTNLSQEIASEDVASKTETPSSKETTRDDIKNLQASLIGRIQNRMMELGQAEKELTNLSQEAVSEDVASKAETPSSTAMTQDDIKNLQASLIERIQSRMMELGQNQGELASSLGITPSYITSTFNGFRWVAKSDRRVIEAIAKYLRVPIIQIFIWSGFFGPDDLVVSNDLPERLNIAYKVMSKDAMVRHIMPPRSEWNLWDEKTRLRFVLLYELTASKVLLGHAQAEYADSDFSKLEWILKKSS